MLLVVENGPNVALTKNDFVLDVVVISDWGENNVVVIKNEDKVVEINNSGFIVVVVVNFNCWCELQVLPYLTIIW